MKPTKLSQLRPAQKILALASEEKINHFLYKLADNLVAQQDQILSANGLDQAQMNADDPKYDRLVLSSERILSMADGLRQIAQQPSPIGTILEQKTLPNQLNVKRVRVPLGVIGMIYEARPNVTTDAIGIAIKTKNALALKGGSDAQMTNERLLKIAKKTLDDYQLPTSSVVLLPPDRVHTNQLVKAVGMVDVIIPRGSRALIDFVRKQACVPVIETGAGIVHTYWDQSGRLDYLKRIIFSAKTRRPSVCNALDTLIVHRDNLPQLSAAIAPLIKREIKIRADKDSFLALSSLDTDLVTPAALTDFGTEFLGKCMSIVTVGSLDEAINHIDQYSSQHSEAIVTQHAERAELFLRQVDAACVFHNTETGFSDGQELGLGAEIGISTQKLHARGPMGLAAMTSSKWVITGSGQTRI